MKLFNFVGNQISTLFGTVPQLKGAQGTAIDTVKQGLTNISMTLVEGKVSPEYGEFAIQKLYEAQLAVNTAITHGWNNGRGSEY